MLLTVGNASLYPQSEVVVMADGHEKDSNNHSCENESYHLRDSLLMCF